MRIAAGIEYIGTAYCGWQQQETVPSVQAEVQKAFSLVANTAIQITCAGRTDRGVHASGQVIHFDTDVKRSEYAWLCGANANLPRDIITTWVKQVDESFHARFSAKSRRYQYLLYNSAIRPVLGANLVSWHFLPLDIGPMQQAAVHLLGQHNFTAFRASACQAKSPVRTIQHIALQRIDRLLIVDIQADGFLHHMVRNIMGVLIKVGENKALSDWPLQLLNCVDRTQAAMTAPAQGLCLTAVGYAESWQLPKQRDGFYAHFSR